MAGPDHSRQLVFDISVLVALGGQAVGITRVVRELARWAYCSRSATFVFYDFQRSSFCLVRSEQVEAIVMGRTIVDMSRQPDPFGTKKTVPHRVPGFLKEAAFWIRNPRRRAIVALMARRSGRSRGLVDALLSFLITPKYRDEFTDPAGGRRMLLPFELIAGDPVELGADHYLLHASSDWPAPVIAHTIERKRAGLQVAFISYDTIPLMFPHFYTAKSSARFRSMFHATMPVADLVMVTAHQVASDIRDYCARNDLPVPGIRVFRPGADLIIDDQAGQTELPPGVEPGKYAIFVSTVEPRKGHALLFRVWKRLVAAGVQQATGFKLVLVGRRGWLTDDLVAEIEGDPTFGSSLLLYSGVADNLLSSLYSNAAFGLYPSLYEGYGLPVVELFKYGKAVIASSGGALREVVADFSPSLDPRDEDVWFETMRDWMEDPSARAPFEAAVRQRFSHPTWDEASATFFGILKEELGQRTNADHVE